MSASLCLIAWNEPIGTPNCSRSLAYSSVMSNACCAVPTRLERERDGRLLHHARAARRRSPGRVSRAPGPASTVDVVERDGRERAGSGRARRSGVDVERVRAGRRTRRRRRRRVVPGDAGDDDDLGRGRRLDHAVLHAGEHVAAVARRASRSPRPRPGRSSRSPPRARACRRAPSVGDRPRKRRLLLGGPELARPRGRTG